MTNYNWQITSMSVTSEVDGNLDVVFQVNWRCEATEDKFSAVSTGSAPVAYAENVEFTPYEQLTQEKVWEWANTSIDRQEVEANLQSLINEQKTQTTQTSPLPWA